MTNHYSLVKVKQDVDDFLRAYFAEKSAAAHVIDEQYGHLWDTMAGLSAAGGKRLRPYVTVVTYQGYGASNYEAILSAAAAQELLHMAMLVHDDIIDRDYVRYGVDNIAGSYAQHYAPMLKSAGERKHFAASAALLAGDLALSGAYELIMRSSLTAPQKAKAHEIISASIFSIVGGELLDTESAFRNKEEVDALKTALLKTASYSFVAPLKLGAALSGASASELRKLRKFGEALGLAYQLSDDILELYGDEAVIGKPLASDIREGKKTYMVLYALQANTDESHKLRGLLGKQNLTEQEVETVRRIMQNTGAKVATETLIMKHLDQAQEIITRLSVNTQTQNTFQELLESLARRSK